MVCWVFCISALSSTNTPKSLHHMKTAERILIGIFILGIVLKMDSILGGAILTALSSTGLMGFYMFFGFAFFNNIPLKNVFSSSAYVDTAVLQIIEAILIGLFLVIIVGGLLFYALHWPGVRVMLTFGAVSCVITTIYTLSRRFFSSHRLYTNILLRLVPLCIIYACIIGYLISKG